MKILKITRCWQCCHRTPFLPYICTVAHPKGIIIPDAFHSEIPDWCPLEDVSQQVAEPDLENLGFCLKCGTRPCTCKEKYSEEKAG